MNWSTIKEIYLRNCVVAYINLDFGQYLVSVDETPILDGRSLLVSGRLHRDTLGAFCTRAASLLNEGRPWDWIDANLKREIDVAETTHRCLRSWVQQLKRPSVTRKLSFTGRLLTCPRLTIVDLKEAFAIADTYHISRGHPEGLSQYPFWQEDLRKMIAERAEELFWTSQIRHPYPNVQYEQKGATWN